MLKKLPEEEFGPEIGIREYSMLDNPSLPLEVSKCHISCFFEHDSLFLNLFTWFQLFCLGFWVQVKKSWLDVQLCKEGTQDCDGSYNSTVGGVLKFPKHSNEEMVFDILFKLIYLRLF